MVSALTGVLGVLGKSFWDAVVRKRAEKKAASEKEELRAQEAVSQLEQLQALLDESWSVFVSQNNQRNRLASLLVRRYGRDVPLKLGYDEAFSRMYDRMECEERELFQIIRGLTMHSMYRVNERLRQWTDNKTARQLAGNSTPAIVELDNQLVRLKAHLSDWFAKYNSFFVGDERRSLVYLGDEKHHGNEFPPGLTPALKKALEEMKQ
jgi:hypothetical protein